MAYPRDTEMCPGQRNPLSYRRRTRLQRTQGEGRLGLWRYDGSVSCQVSSARRRGNALVATTIVLVDIMIVPRAGGIHRRFWICLGQLGAESC